MLYQAQERGLFNRSDIFAMKKQVKNDNCVQISKVTYWECEKTEI